MRRWLLGAALLVSFSAFAAETVQVGETTTIEVPGATAAYAIDTTLVDVTLGTNGVVQLTGRSAGSTQLIAITPSGTRSFLITIGASASAAAPQRPPSGTFSHESARYVSQPKQIENTFDVFLQDGERRSQFHLMNVHYLGETFARSHDVIPSAFYRITTPRREVTLLDDFVDVSPLTVTSTQLRGIHWKESGLEVHAGYTASTLFEDLFLPSDRRWVAGAGYSVRRGGIVCTPSVYGFFSEPRNSSARRGVVASLAAERGNGETYDVRGELAVANAIGASAEFRYETPHDRATGRFVFKPDDFPTLGLADLRGTHATTEWTHRASERLTFDSYGTYDRFRIGTLRQTSAALNADFRYALWRYVALTSGVDATDLRVTATEAIRTISFPLGVLFDAPHFGAAATYRMIDNSAASRRGDALRLSLRASTHNVNVTAWGERQRVAPTLSLIFRDEPGLELALLRLGISVHTPEDVARALRDNAVLVNLGFIQGVTVDLAPKRSLAGIDATWLLGANTLRLHGIYDREEGVREVRDGAIATASLAHRFNATSEAYAAYTRYRSNGQSGSAVEAGVRTNVETLPQLLRRKVTISGFVLVDPDGTPLPDAVVTLDSTRTAHTDARGAYTFAGVEPGAHRVAAQLPHKPAFFTTPSRVETAGNARVDFHLVWTPARISGRVVSDVSLGVPGVTVTLGPQLRATTDMNGAYAINAPAGDYHVAVATETLPPGYTIAGASERDVKLVADQPQQLDFEVHALRSIAGTAAPNTEVTIAPLGRRVIADAQGRYVFRSLPAGTFTIAANGATQTVTLPAEPTTLHLEWSDRRPRLSSNEQTTGEDARRSTAAAAYRVQVGAYRVPQNADDARAEVERLGMHAMVEQSGALQVVSAGPFATRDEAERAATKLTDAGVENYLFGDAAAAAPLRESPAYVVQVGAFREPANARQLTGALRRRGEKPFTVTSGDLTLVRTGPFHSRQAATAASERLRKAGFDALIVPR
jgi:cell division septation protein DedD